MKKLLFSLGLAGLLMFALGGTASAHTPTLAGASPGGFAPLWTALGDPVAPTALTTPRTWAYKPAKKGAYRLQVTIAKTATHVAARTKWLGFKVK